MESSRAAPAVFILPNPDLGPCEPGPTGFEGLNATERSAHAEMLHRAYSIWECKGRPDSSQLADWLEAEAEVLGETRVG